MPKLCYSFYATIDLEKLCLEDGSEEEDDEAGGAADDDDDDAGADEEAL